MNALQERPFPFSDLALARRLEQAEGRSGAEFVESRAHLFPDSRACWIEVGGALAMYDGVESPATQTFGLGIHKKPMAADMERLEAFFQERGAPIYHEVSPLADLDGLVLLNERGYEPFEFTSVLFQPIQRELRLPLAPDPRIQVRRVREGEHDVFAQVSARGWSEYPAAADQLREFARVSANRAGSLAFLAELDGQAIASGMLYLSDGVALLAGASTVPEARKQGAQLALLEGRLRFAAEQGCDLAMMGALPGSASQRNAERHGFRIGYTRIKWRLRGRR